MAVVVFEVLVDESVVAGGRGRLVRVQSHQLECHVETGLVAERPASVPQRCPDRGDRFLDGPDDLLAELFLEIEKAATGLDLSTVVATDLAPDRSRTVAIVNAILSEDLPGLHRAVLGDFSDLLEALVVTVAALELSI